MNYELKKPLWAIGYVFFFLCIQAMASTAVLGFNMLILKKEATELDPISMIVATGLFTIATIAVFAWLKWSPLSKSFLLLRRWDILLWTSDDEHPWGLCRDLPLCTYCRGDGLSRRSLKKAAAVEARAPLADDFSLCPALCPGPHEPRTVPPSATHRFAAGLDVRAHGQYHSRHRVSLGQQFCGLPPVAYLSGS